MRMKKLGLSLLAAVTLLVTSLSASATLLTFNGQSVTALDLNGISTSFEEFYDYQSSSANTGLEVVNTVIMFVAELDDEYGIFTIANKYGAGGVNGKLSVDITSSSGNVIFVDDAIDFTSANQIDFSWGGNLTDGYIYYELNPNGFVFSQALSSLKGVDGVNFINFSDGTLSSATYGSLMSLDNPFVIKNVVQVSAPAGAFMLIFGLVCLVTRRRIKI
jgi:hypothetical protein